MAVIGLNLPETFCVMRGVLMLGATLVPIDTGLVKVADLYTVLENCRPKMILVNNDLYKHLTGVNCWPIENAVFSDQNFSGSHAWGENETLIIPYTSGTTGGQKGVELTLGNISDRVEAISKELNVADSERLLSYMPLGHISELVATFFGQLESGYTVYFTEYARYRIDNPQLFINAFPKILSAIKPTIFLGAPLIWSRMREKIEHKTRFIPVNLAVSGFWQNLLAKIIKREIGLDQARIFVSAAALLKPSDAEFFSNPGIEIDDIYGQTETAGPLTINGKPIGKIVIKAGENDEMLIEGRCVMKGYYNDPELTESVFNKGAYKTGDAGIWEEESVYWGGRIRDGFKLANGQFVSAQMVEKLQAQIKDIDGVNEALVFGENKEHICALIFSGKLVDQAKIRKEIALIPEATGMFKIGSVLFKNTSELELTATFKVKRTVMLKKYAKEIEKL